ncbi:hypothetical protein BFJ63_vAg16477 [Fusarium oxysporum f. sp. narcissi]|uniref:Uncharacterized protein n=3 Tax=Fusarium oxysporum TaxID=5507 RepID=A0A420RN23_FUSOX|nr:hypothetical protein BFJ65_g492 [Fusarium oxysporum f. sp. cepae]RKK43402.1 hypothetical protein BFJ66_g9996 [Fusarium oxysporum f. sp. cepae]RKK81236.1 hypothetical protein BFJ69_g3818 [Fusarium oxysporum]RKL18441.1 hypothetical protein BFJ68_g4141 [Fusarium oxysporum]RYC80642.1 hypothetical protein BFJ63_vAg16477 [Fusarium oxysporum f. sp. narcissi]
MEEGLSYSTPCPKQAQPTAQSLNRDEREPSSDSGSQIVQETTKTPTER